MPRVTMGRNGRDIKGTKGDIKKYQEGWLEHLNGCYQPKKKKRLKFFSEEFGNGQVMGTMDWMMRGIMVDVGGTKKDLKYIQGKFEPFFGPKI